MNNFEQRKEIFNVRVKTGKCSCIFCVEEIVLQLKISNKELI